jgi:DDE superfamily endonuclease
MQLTEKSTTTTLAKKGQKVVHVRFRKGSDKRLCTLQVCVSLFTQLNDDGENIAPQPKILIIFKGKGHIKQEERDAWSRKVDVKFQANAWMDHEVQTEWVSKTLAPFVNEVLDPAELKVLILDNLACQTSEEFERLLRDLNIERRLLPSDCTDNIQPLDRHIMKQLKKRIGLILERMLDEDVELNQAWYNMNDKTLPAWKVRVLVTQIVGDAWEEICKEKDFLKTGLETGCVMFRKGAADLCGIRVKIDGVDDYSFGPEDIGEPPIRHEDALKSIQDYGESEEDESASSSEEEKSIVNEAVKKKRKKVLKQLDGTDEEDDYPAKNEIEEDPVNDEFDEYQDDTAIISAPTPTPPDGFAFKKLPIDLKLSKIIKQRVYWYLNVFEGSPGWIMSTISSGPKDPAESRKGITMHLLSTRRMDKKIPKAFEGNNNTYPVAFTSENYGNHWFLLVNEEDIESEGSDSSGGEAESSSDGEGNYQNGVEQAETEKSSKSESESESESDM